MNAWVWIVIAVVAVVVVLTVVWRAARARRTRTLQETFGREYERTVEHAGDRSAAERELRERQKRHEELDIRPLSPESRDRYVRRWQSTQTRFVDDPKGAVAEADQLVQEVMQERGYPVKDFDRRVADISVDHPDLVERYRTAHGIAGASDRGEATTEDMRHSVRHYRALFAELLEVDDESAVVENVDDISSRDEEPVDTQRVERLR
jgi:FtsZ-interacting cell division protein ZipA